MELLGGKKDGTELLEMDGTYGSEKEWNGTFFGMDGTCGRVKGWNGTFRDGWNFWEGRGVERERNF